MSLNETLFLEHLSKVTGKDITSIIKAFSSGFESWKNAVHFGTPERVEIFYGYVKARGIKKFQRYDDGFATIIPQTDFDSKAQSINTTLYLDGNYGFEFKMNHESEFEFPDF